jgi:hypothetical protein
VWIHQHCTATLSSLDLHYDAVMVLSGHLQCTTAQACVEVVLDVSNIYHRHFVGCLENVSSCAGVSLVLCAAFMEAYMTHYGAYMVHQYPYLVHTGVSAGVCGTRF